MGWPLYEKREVPSGIRPLPCVARTFWHRLVLPDLQNLHSRHSAVYSWMTWSPACRVVTPSPTSTTTPAPSWPRTAGNRPSGSSPLRVNASVWQTPVWVMRTSTSPARGGATSISTICKGWPGAKATAARDFMAILCGNGRGAGLTAHRKRLLRVRRLSGSKAESPCGAPGGGAPIHRRRRRSQSQGKLGKRPESALSLPPRRGMIGRIESDGFEPGDRDDLAIAQPRLRRRSIVALRRPQCRRGAAVADQPRGCASTRRRDLPRLDFGRPRKESGGPFGLHDQTPARSGHPPDLRTQQGGVPAE